MDTFDNRISQIYPTLGEASQHVADYFRHNYAAVAGFSLRSLKKNRCVNRNHLTIWPPTRVCFV